MIRVKVRTILDIKKLLGAGELDFSLPESSSLDDLLALMVDRWGEELGRRLKARSSLGDFPVTRLLINGRDIAFLQGMETVLREGDEVLILPAVSGG